MSMRMSTSHLSGIILGSLQGHLLDRFVDVLFTVLIMVILGLLNGFVDGLFDEVLSGAGVGELFGRRSSSERAGKADGKLFKFSGREEMRLGISFPPRFSIRTGPIDLPSRPNRE